MRRLFALCLLGLMACAAPAAPSPTAPPRPTELSLPTQAPVGPTILPSDLGANPTANPASSNVPPATATSAPPPTPAAVGFDFALRPEFKQDMTATQNKTVYTINWKLNEDLSQLQGTQRVIFANNTDQP